MDCRKTGFTFIELLISSTILLLIVGGIFTIFHVAEISWNNDMNLLILSQRLHQTIDGMTRELRASNPSAIDIGGSNGQRIAFRIAASSKKIKYELNDDNQIVRTHPATGPLAERKETILASNINSLNFSLDGNIVTIQIQAGKTVRGKDYKFSLSEQALLRN